MVGIFFQMPAKLVFQLVSLVRLAAARGRALWWRLMGATLGAKVSLGPRVRIDRPWLATVGRRTTAEADVWFKIEADTARLVIGEFCFLGRGVELDCTQAITIGDRVLIAPGVFITDHNHRVGMEGTGRIVDQGCVPKSVVIADDVWVGHGATILQA